MKNIEFVINKLKEDSIFAGKDSSYASHNFHAFAAKFPPQLPRIFIENLTKEGDKVLDPMAGSGTALVESLLMNRRGIGFDIDPLAIHLSRIKTSSIRVDEVREEANKVIKNAIDNFNTEKAVKHELENGFDLKTKEFINYWFKEKTQKELMALLLAINLIEDNKIKAFFKLVFSSIIITKSGGVSLAMDLAHSRPHRINGKIPKNAIEAFSTKLFKMLKGIENIPVKNYAVNIDKGDARNLPLKNDVIDLIITSPPYANAIDYMRAHKFSLVWFNNSINDLSVLRSKYIGSEKISGFNGIELPQICEDTIEKVNKLDQNKSKILKKYFAEMKQVIYEMYRVLKNNKYCVIVVGNSTMRGYEVQTHKNIEILGQSAGFTAIANIERELDRNKRMMPISFNSQNDGIEQRMHKEYIIIFQKRE